MTPGEHDLTWERMNNLMAENGRLDREIDRLVDEKKALKAALRLIAGWKFPAPPQEMRDFARAALDADEESQAA